MLTAKLIRAALRHKPYKAVSKNTISRWIRFVMAKAGIDVSQFKAHSTRAASASKLSKFASIDSILKAGGWSSDSCFKKHYNLPSIQPLMHNVAADK